jgi:hypothetical protein
MQFTADDIPELSRRGHSPASIAEQIHRFTHDLRPVKLEHACTPGDGITRFDASECHHMLTIFEREAKRFRLQKFVPASGAATRMFEHLFNFSQENISQLTETFILHFRRFPFYDTLLEKLAAKGVSLEALEENNKWKEIFGYILGPEGLHYGDTPKGLVAFHRYQHEVRTAFEEHLPEALEYARNADGSGAIHFTLAPAHVARVCEFLEEKIHRKYPYDPIHITHSVQELSTETIALDRRNEPARDQNGRLIFRPSGHGALIYNLQQCDADILFIKNIDNVTTDSQRESTIFYKKVLGGLLIKLKTQADLLLQRLEQGDTGCEADALEFIQHWFQPGLPLGMSLPQLRAYARLRLDRPLRVCGMVRNEGEPGGGPFWVRMSDGHLSKQIVEKSQVDTSDVQQARILSESTHFNPVDIVCAITNRKGERYALDQFIDYSTGFVSDKFHQGKVIKALELPGLWNGAMALWNTVFVEVPVSTFHPVKTVNDLLRPGHIEADHTD